MKIRECFVSNSSSSSFIIAYDKSFFGDLNSFLRNEKYIGCETYFHDIEDMDNFYKWAFDDKNEIKKLKEKIEKSKQSGMEILYIDIDHDYEIIFNFLKHLKKIHKDKVKFLYVDVDWDNTPDGEMANATDLKSVG